MAHTPPQSGLALTDPGGFGFVVDQIRPVERSAREIAEAEYRAGGLQWSESLDGGPPPTYCWYRRRCGSTGKERATLAFPALLLI